MKALILYESKTGHTAKMAEAIAAGMKKVESVEVKVCSIDDVDLEWAHESKCIILGTPTYMASVSANIKVFLEGPIKKCEPAGKIGGAFATADYAHGGADLAIRMILDHMMVLGMLTYSGGGSFGKPPIHLGPVAITDRLDDYEGVFMLYGERVATKTAELFG